MFYLIRFLLIFPLFPLAAMEYNPTSLQFKAANVVKKKIDHQDIARTLPSELQERVNFLTTHYRTRDALRIAVAHSADQRLIQDLIENLGNQVNTPDKNGTTELMYAAQCGNLFAVKLLIKKDHVQLHKEHYNYDGQHILHCAARSGNLEICQELVQAFSLHQIEDKPNGNNQYPWQIAAEQGDPELCQYMTEYILGKPHFIDVQAALEKCFIRALCAGKPQNAEIIFNAFLLNRPDRTINSLMDEDEIYGPLTPLMWAGIYGKVNSCQWLLDHGAQLDIQNRQRFTALSLAYLEGTNVKQTEALFNRYQGFDDRQQLRKRISHRTLNAFYVCINAAVPVSFLALCISHYFKKS